MFKEGQVVYFKSWERMVKEYKVYGSSICCLYHFTREMKFLCDKKFKIDIIDKKRLYGSYFNENSSKWIRIRNYSISTDMVCVKNENRRIE